MQFKLTWLVFVSTSFDSHVHVPVTRRLTTWLFRSFTSVLGYFRAFRLDIFREVSKYVPCWRVTCDHVLRPISIASFGDTHLLGAYPDNLSEVASL